jgi:hypothetical protein
MDLGDLEVSVPEEMTTTTMKMTREASTI